MPSDSQMSLPLCSDETQTTPKRGLWYDKDRGQWRVRLYKNGRAYFPRPSAYFDTYDEALAAYTALKNEVRKIQRTAKTTDVADDLFSIWRQCVGASAVQRITLIIEPENI